MNGKTSKYCGVSWDKRKRKWVASIKVGGKARFLGRFADEEAAARAYDEAARDNPNPHARINFPSPVDRALVERTELPDRFWRKVSPEPTTGCWLWTGADVLGYGHLELNGRFVRAHRAAWRDQRGSIPDGMVIDHVCRTPACINPDHLRLATQAENVRHAAPRAGTSRFRGVWRDRRRGGWQAMLRADGEVKFTGRFESEEEAARAYDAAAERHHGRFAMTNRKLGLLAMPLLLASCLSAQLRKPAAEHHAQLQMLTESCERDGWDQGFCSMELLRLQVTKACLIASVAEGRSGEECRDEE